MSQSMIVRMPERWVILLRILTDFEFYQNYSIPIVLLCLCFSELGQLSGVAAILRFPMAEIANDDDEDENSSEED